MAAAVRALGEDYVFDTNYTADLTIMALYSEYLEKPLSHLSHTLLHTDQTTWSL